MKCAYVTKSSWAENSPGFIFSYFQAFGISENKIDVTLIIQNPKNTIAKKKKMESSSSDYFNIKLIKNNFGIVKAHEIFYMRANKYILSNNFDVVFTRDPGYLPFLVKLKNRANKKIYYQSHNFYLDFNIHEYIRSDDRKKFNRYEKKYLNNLDGMMTLNNPQKKLYQKYVDIPISSCPPGLKLTGKKSKFNNQEVAYCGSFQPLKGIESIIKLWKDHLFDYKLSLVGGRNDNELSYVNNIIAKNNIDNVKLNKWVFYNDLPDIITRSSVGLIILPDNFYNKYLTAPNKLFDYISFGMPVVCTDFPSIRDLIPKDHQGVRFIKPGDTQGYVAELKRLLTEEKYYNELQQSNLTLSESLSWKKQSANLIKSIRSKS